MAYYNTRPTYDPKTDKDSQALKNHPTNPEFPDFASDLQNEDGPMPLSYRFSDVCKVLNENIATGPVARRLEPLAQMVQDRKVYNTKINTINKTSKGDESEETADGDWIDLEGTLQKIFHIIDDAFFFGSLKDHVRLDIRSYKTGKEFEDIETALAFFNCGYKDPFQKGERSSQRLAPEEFYLPEFLREEPKTTITMLLFHIPKEVTDPLAFWIGTLAHESLHAMIDIYSCECWKKCLEENRDPLTGKGWTAHGSNFCEILEGIQNSLSAELGIGKISCSINCAAGMEMMASGWIPTDSQCERWGLPDKKKIADILQSKKQIGPIYSSVNEFTRARIDDWLRLNDEANTNTGLLAGFCSKACIAMKGAKMAYRVYQAGPNPLG